MFFYAYEIVFGSPLLSPVGVYKIDLQFTLILEEYYYYAPFL